MLVVPALLGIQRRLERRLVDYPALATDQLDDEHVASVPVATERILLTEGSIGTADHLPPGELGYLPGKVLDLGLVLDLVGDQRGALFQVVVDHGLDQAMP